MRWLRWLSAFLFLASVAHGQLSVQVKAEKDTFLVYESIPLTVFIRNFSGRTIELTSDGDKPWLSFLVLDESGSIMPALGAPKTEEPALIAPGQTVSRTIDLLPLYDIRARGNYRVQARITNAISTPISLTVINGREIWSQTTGLPPQDGAPDEYRTYSLLARRAEQLDMLHICVRDDPHQTVYGVIALGGFITMQNPEARVDPQGHLHVLYQVGPRTYGYAHVDPNARVVDREVYSDYLSRPSLTITNGQIAVRGGERSAQRSEHVMSEEELKPSPRPSPPPPKRHWWWPFGGSSAAPPAK